MSHETIHVERSGDCWQVSTSGGDGILSRHRRRLDAIADAMTQGNMHRREVVIHELDGSTSGPFGQGIVPPDMLLGR